MADVIDRGVIEIVGDARKLRASIEDAKKAIRTLGEGQKDISKSASASIDRYIAKLQQQNATFDKSIRQTELFKLAQRGASDEQIKSADIALRIAERNEKAAASMKKLTADAVRFGAVAGTAIAAGLTAAAVAFEVLISKAAAFQDLSEKTGETAENLASLAVAAAVGGTNMEAVGAAAIKLTKNLTGVDDEADDAGAAIKALGLNISDFKNLSPADQLQTVAEALRGFEDGATKSAVAMALFGKAGAEMLPFLKELAGETGRQNILTQEQIELADEYKDKQAKLIAQFSLQAQAIAADLIPAYTDLQQAFFDTIKGIIGIDDEADQLANSTAIRDFADSAAKSIAVVIDGLDLLIRAFKVAGKTIAAYAASMERLQKFDFRGAITAVQALGEDVRNITDKPLFSTNLENRRNERQNRQTNQTPPQDRQRLLFEGKAKKEPKGPKEQDTSRQDAAAQLAFDLDQIKKAGDAQIDAFKNAESIMEALRSAQLVADKEYFASKLGFIQSFEREDEAALQAQIKRREAEAEIIRARGDKDATKDLLDNERQIAALQAQIAKVQADAATKRTINSIQEKAASDRIVQGYEDAKKAAEAYLETIARRNALEIQGIGRGQRFRETNAGRSDIDERLLGERRRLEGERRRQQITQEQFDTYLARAQDTYQKEIELYEQRTDILLRAEQNWVNGALEALNNYADEAKNVAKTTEGIFTNAFKSAEDSITEFLDKADFSFKSLKDTANNIFKTISSDLNRAFVKQGITGPIAEWLKDKLPSGGLGGIFEGGGIFGGVLKGGAGTVAKGGAEAANAAQFSTAVTTAGTGFSTSITTAATTASTELTTAGATFSAEASTAGATFGVETTTAGATITASAATFSAEVIAAGSAFAASVGGASATSGAGGAASILGDLFDGFADGGQVTGPGTGTSDSIPAMLSNREFVVQAAKVAEPGALPFLKTMNDRGFSAAAAKVIPFARGGLVGKVPPAPYIGSFQNGIARVPQTGLALLHKGERVVPKDQNAGDTHINLGGLTFNGPQSRESVSQGIVEGTRKAKRLATRGLA